MNLSPEDQAEYDRRCAINVKAKDEATARGDAKAAKKARQANTALYWEFKAKEIPVASDPEDFMTLEMRIIRIEQHLKLGRYA